MKKYLLLAPLFAMLCISCEPISLLPKEDPDPNTPKHEARDMVFNVTDTDIHQCQTTYSLLFLQQVSKNSNGNFMISPISAEMVLAMLMNGAEGTTRDEIINALQMSAYTPEQINSYHQKLITALPYLDTQTQIKIANALWIRPELNIKQNFLSTTQDYYAASIEALDLSNPFSADRINNWADTCTNHLINKVITRDEMNDNLRMIIANALYFKGSWSAPFIPEQTYNEDFAMANGTKKSVPIMHKTHNFCIAPAKKDGFQASFLRLYYNENKYCMDILLPTEQATANDILAAMTTSRLDSLVAASYTHEVDLKLPRFKSTYDRQLNSDMKALGIKQIFTQNAEMGAITEAENLYLSMLKQMTYINVDEEGTEAAAVTIGLVNTTSIREPEPPIPFYATHPFIYFIRDAEHGAILFAGILAQP